MPQSTNYPNTSLKKAIEFSDKVASTKGGTTLPGVAALLGSKSEGGKSGALGNQCSAAVKFGLVRRQQGRIFVTELGGKIAAAYSPEEKKHLARQAFLNLPVYDRVVQQLGGTQAPEASHLTKWLFRECDVPMEVAPRIANFFIKEGRKIGIIDESGQIIPPSATKETRDETQSAEDNEANLENEGGAKLLGNESSASPDKPEQPAAPDSGGFRVRIWNEAQNLEWPLKSKVDFAIVEAVLGDIKEALGFGSNGAEEKEGKGE